MIEGTGTFVTYNGAEPLLNRWQNPGDITNVPKVVYAAASGNNNTLAASTSTRFLHDGDYMRLRDVTFGYNFKKNITVTGGYSQMFGSKTMEFIKNGDANHTNNWAWLMISVDPKIFSWKK